MTVTEYQKRSMRKFSFMLNRSHDAELIKWLAEKPNMAGFIKTLLYEAMKAESRGVAVKRPRINSPKTTRGERPSSAPEKLDDFLKRRFSFRELQTFCTGTEYERWVSCAKSYKSLYSVDGVPHELLKVCEWQVAHHQIKKRSQIEALQGLTFIPKKYHVKKRLYLTLPCHKYGWTVATNGYHWGALKREVTIRTWPDANTYPDLKKVYKLGPGPDTVTISRTELETSIGEWKVQKMLEGEKCMLFPIFQAKNGEKFDASFLIQAFDLLQVDEIQFHCGNGMLTVDTDDATYGILALRMN